MEWFGGTYSVLISDLLNIIPGITIVVSPLVSLMEDQLMALRKKNIEARMLSADAPKETVNEVHNVRCLKYN